MHKIFCNEAIRARVQRDQDRIDHQFDIAILNEANFLQYSDNMDLIYFWNVPYCVFSTITGLITQETYSYYICRGIALSAGGLTETTMNEAVKSLTSVLASLDPESPKDSQTKTMILGNFLKALEKYRKREKYITPIFNTLAYLFTTQDAFNFLEYQGQLETFLEIIWLEIKTTKFTAKLSAAAGLCNGIFTAIFSQERFKANTIEQNFDFLRKNEGLNIIEHLLIHEFPKVSKLMSEKFYNFLSVYGASIWGDAVSEKLEDFVTGTDWLTVLVPDLPVKKTQWRS